jgi:DNA-binding NarL/FixJ family response regulator
MDNHAHRARVFLVDDHPLVRQGLGLVLSQAGFAVCGEAGSIAETLAHRHLPRADLVVVDLSLSDENGLDLIAVLTARGMRVLTYSVHEDAIHVQGAMAAGASAYVTKREVAQYLMDAMAAVLAGRTYVSPRA